MVLFLDGYSGYNPMFTYLHTAFAFKWISFELCNVQPIFQRCMMSIFSEMVEKNIEIYMDDFSMMRDSFVDFLAHLNYVLKRCKECNLVVNWEKCHFMVKEGLFSACQVPFPILEKVNFECFTWPNLMFFVALHWKFLQGPSGNL